MHTQHNYIDNGMCFYNKQHLRFTIFGVQRSTYLRYLQYVFQAISNSLSITLLISLHILNIHYKIMFCTSVCMVYWSQTQDLVNMSFEIIRKETYIRLFWCYPSTLGAQRLEKKCLVLAKFERPNPRTLQGSLDIWVHQQGTKPQFSQVCWVLQEKPLEEGHSLGHQAICLCCHLPQVSLVKTTMQYIVDNITLLFII